MFTPFAVWFFQAFSKQECKNMFSWFLTIVYLALTNRIMTFLHLDCALRGLCVFHLLFCHCHRRASPGNCCALSQSSRVNTVNGLNKAQTSARPSTALHTAWDRTPSKPSLCEETPMQAKIRELNYCLFLCEANILWWFIKQHYCTSSKTISRVNAHQTGMVPSIVLYVSWFLFHHIL